MSSIDKVKKSVGHTTQDAKHNVRRYAENFPSLDRGVGYFNANYSHTTRFHVTPGQSAFVNMRFLDLKMPCTINSPDTKMECVGWLTGSNPGAITYLASNTGTTADGVGFTLDGAGHIVAPVDGCYTLYFQSGAAGYTQMRGDAIVGSAITHNDTVVKGLQWPAEGVWGFMGGVWTYSPPSPFYAYVAALAGDTFGAILTQSVTGVIIDWFGPRDFSLWLNDPGTTTLTVKLIAQAEG